MVRLFLVSILATLCFGLSAAPFSSDVIGRCRDQIIGLADLHDSVRWDGAFQDAPRAKMEFLKDLFRVTGGNTFTHNYTHIRRATGQDVKVSTCSGQAMKCQVGRAELHQKTLPNRPSTFPPEMGFLAPALQRLGFTGFHPLYCFVSGAGNWRRGGKMVKALVPLNIKESLDEGSWRQLLALSEFATADHTKRMSLYGNALADQAPFASLLRVNDTEAVEAELRRLIHRSRQNVASINPLEAKIAQVAMLSVLHRRYIHFDLWTSRATHSEIRDALRDFSKNYRDKIFFVEPELNAFMHDAIGRYLDASALLGETHIFGYQEEVYALSPDPETADFLPDEERNGEGAGMAYEVLQTTGRLPQLKLRGIEHWMFQNIEVISMDLMAQYGAYLQLDKPVGVVVVPERDGYSGGYPFIATNRDGDEVTVLLEGTGLPPYLKERGPDGIFNTNTMISRVALNPVFGMDFEPKTGRSGRVIVPKMSLGFQTHTNLTGLIGGDIGWDYQNFKQFEDYGRSGPEILQLFRSVHADAMKAHLGL